MKKLSFAALGLVALVASPAMAADLSRPVYKAPPPPPVYVFSWTGCYVGGNVGGVWLNKDFALTSVTTPFGVVTPPFGAVGLGSHTASSWIGGLQVGCNYQVPGSGWVFGIQGDYDWTNANGSHADPVLALTTLQSTARSVASVTGRVGYAWDRFLGYVKGGGAWERDNYSWFVTAAPAVALSASETRGGWTVGIGGEYAFTNWITGFIEYDYYDFGTRSIAFPIVVAPASVNLDIRERKSVFKVGLNFLFGAGGAPVAARY
jgi:outer membrane immunogenic protein